MPLKHLLRLIFVALISNLNIINTIAENTPLDQALKPDTLEEESASSVFRDMGVVQRKAMNKARKVLFSSYLAMDFSDGPYSMYGIHTNFGYAFSDFFEIYFNLAPAFINSKRSIVTKVEALTLQNGAQATITTALAKREFGLDIIWAPLYGKDSLGTQTVVRSDTFVKLGGSMIQFNSGQGLKFQLGLGKTYFLFKKMGLRVVASTNYVQTITDGVKSFNPILIIETGLVAYLF